MTATILRLKENVNGLYSTVTYLEKKHVPEKPGVYILSSLKVFQTTTSCMAILWLSNEDKTSGGITANYPLTSSLHKFPSG